MLAGVGAVGVLWKSMIETPEFRERRRRIAKGLPLEGCILLISSGEPIPLPETSDQVYPFRAHADYVYASGLDVPGAVLAFDPEWGPEDGWLSFVPEVTEDERVWEGREQPPGRPVRQLEAWLNERSGRRVCNLGADAGHHVVDTAVTSRCRASFQHIRRRKDAHEIALLKKAAAATAEGFNNIRDTIKPGVSERLIQIELEAGFFRKGGNRTGYDSIVASGPNAAVLHFAPGQRTVSPGEFVLIDAGAEVDRYVCDVSRTFVVGEPSAFQRDLYQIVLDAEKAAIARCHPFAEWRDIHLGAATSMAEGLVDMGVMRGNAQSLVERAAHTLFFPHGIGHMVGLGVRDASGVALGRRRSEDPALKTLRCDLPIETGYVMTVEPGLYFIPPLLNDPARRKRYRDAVNWEVVDQHLGIGGVRIEDNILVREEGEPEILTAAIPKDLHPLPA